MRVPLAKQPDVGDYERRVLRSCARAGEGRCAAVIAGDGDVKASHSCLQLPELSTPIAKGVFQAPLLTHPGAHVILGRPMTRRRKHCGEYDAKEASGSSQSCVSRVIRD